MENTNNIENMEEARALATFLGVNVEDLTEIDHVYGPAFRHDGCDYLVLTDEEADEAFYREIDLYVEEMIDRHIPDFLLSYFDVDSYKEDLANYEDRGRILATYDGVENFVEGENDDFYIYRVS